MDLDMITETLSSAGSHALSPLIYKTRSNYDLGYGTYTTLFHACVTPILDYACGAWHVGKCSKIDNVQYMAVRFYCGLPKSCPLISLTSEMGQTPGVIRRDVETVRLYN